MRICLFVRQCADKPLSEKTTGCRNQCAYWLRSALYTAFIAFRMYFVASVSVASACLIVLDGTVRSGPLLGNATGCWWS
jgi:hypothetical protein